MLNTTAGQILVADHDGVHVIKMTGDVRLTLCVSFDRYIETLFSQKNFCTIFFDLSNAQCLDSTTLGLIAKIALKTQAINNTHPFIICDNKDIERLLASMGIDSICQLMASPPEGYCHTQQFANLDSCDDEQCVVKEKVLEAHCVLMDLNESNRETFKDLVKTLHNTP